MNQEYCEFTHESREYRNELGQLHRLDGPAIVNLDPRRWTAEEWWLDGMPHRIDGPAIIFNGSLDGVVYEYWFRGHCLCRSNQFFCKDEIKQCVLEHFYYDLCSCFEAI